MGAVCNITYLLTPLAQRPKVSLGLRNENMPFLPVPRDFLPIFDSKITQVSLHSVFPAIFGTADRTSTYRPSQIRFPHTTILSHPFHVTEPAEAVSLYFSYYVGLGHEIFNLEVSSDPPATILSLSWTQNLTENLPFRY